MPFKLLARCDRRLMAICLVLWATRYQSFSILQYVTNGFYQCLSNGFFLSHQSAASSGNEVDGQPQQPPPRTPSLLGSRDVSSDSMVSLATTNSSSGGRSDGIMSPTADNPFQLQQQQHQHHQQQQQLQMGVGGRPRSVTTTAPGAVEDIFGAGTKSPFKRSGRAGSACAGRSHHVRG